MDSGRAMLAPTGADVGAAIGRPLRKENSTPKRAVSLEQDTGIEPATVAWEATILPLN